VLASDEEGAPSGQPDGYVARFTWPDLGCLRRPLWVSSTIGRAWRSGTETVAQPRPKESKLSRNVELPDYVQNRLAGFISAADGEPAPERSTHSVFADRNASPDPTPSDSLVSVSFSVVALVFVCRKIAARVLMSLENDPAVRASGSEETWRIFRCRASHGASW
jgi:hypothetical protein